MSTASNEKNSISWHLPAERATRAAFGEAGVERGSPALRRDARGQGSARYWVRHPAPRTLPPLGAGDELRGLRPGTPPWVVLGPALGRGSWNCYYPPARRAGRGCLRFLGPTGSRAFRGTWALLGARLSTARAWRQLGLCARGVEPGPPRQGRALGGGPGPGARGAEAAAAGVGMSGSSKVVLGVSVVLTAATVVGVHMKQRQDQQVGVTCPRLRARAAAEAWGLGSGSAWCRFLLAFPFSPPTSEAERPLPGASGKCGRWSPVLWAGPAPAPRVSKRW